MPWRVSRRFSSLLWSPLQRPGWQLGLLPALTLWRSSEPSSCPAQSFPADGPRSDIASSWSKIAAQPEAELFSISRPVFTDPVAFSVDVYRVMGKVTAMLTRAGQV